MSGADMLPREAVNDILEDIRDYAAVAAGETPMPEDHVRRDAINDILEDIRGYMKTVSENASSDATKGVSHIGPTAPADPVDGKLWFNTTTGRLFIWYDDGNSAQWVQTVP